MNDTLNEAWDCCPAFVPENLDYDFEIDYEDSESDWQIIALDRFYDRQIRY